MQSMERKTGRGLTSPVSFVLAFPASLFILLHKFQVHAVQEDEKA